MIDKRLLVALGLATVVGMHTVGAQGELVTSDAWAYQALQTLVKHGAITDTKGIQLDGGAYTRDELTPLIAYAVEKREVMNENDKQLVLRLYDEYRRDLLNYNVAQEDARKAAKLKAQEEKEGKVIDVMDAPLPKEEKALTEEQIQEKMAKFQVDMSALQGTMVKRSGDVVFHVSPTGKNGRQRLEISLAPEKPVHMVAAPTGLVPLENPLEERPLTPAELKVLEKEKQAALKKAQQEEKRLAKERAKRDKAAAQEAKRLEKERLAAEKKARKAALVARKKAKQEQLAAEKQAKQARLAAEKAAKQAAKAKAAAK